MAEALHGPVTSADAPAIGSLERVRVVLDSVKGRSLVATRDIRAGDVILREHPLVAAQFSWNKACHYLACHHCLRSLEPAQDMARYWLPIAVDLWEAIWTLTLGCAPVCRCSSSFFGGDELEGVWPEIPRSIYHILNVAWRTPPKMSPAPAAR